MNRRVRCRNEMPSTLTTQRLPKAPTALNRAAPVLLALPLICFSVLLLTYAVNVPWMDDIDAFLNFMVGYDDAPTFAAKLDWLLRPNNEHRILTAKLLTLAMDNLTGAVNFRGLILIAFVFLLGILYLFYHVFRGFRLPLLAFVPVAFILLQPQHYLCSIWAITGLQHQVVVLLTLSAVYLLAGGGRGRFAGATALQVLASLSMSNGLFGWVAGVVVLVRQRHWRRLAVWLVAGGATVWFYFHDFQSAQGNGSSVSFFLAYPYLVFSGFFTFTGALFDFFLNVPIFWRSVLPTGAGFVLFAVMLGLLWRMNEAFLRGRSGRDGTSDVALVSLEKRRLFFTGCYAFLMVNAVVVAFLRPRMGYWVMLVSNYMLYPALLTALLYLNLLSEYARSATTRWVRLGLGMSMLVWGASYFVHWPQVAYRKQLLLSDAYNQQHNDIGFGATWGTPFAEVAARTMNEAVKRGLYRYPTGYFTPYESVLKPAPNAAPDPTLRLNVSGGGYSYLAEATGVGALPPAEPAAVVVQSGRRSYLFVSEEPYTRRNFWLHRPVTTVRAEVVNSMLAPDRYRVGILAPALAGPPLRFSQQRITVR